MIDGGGRWRRAGAKRTLVFGNDLIVAWRSDLACISRGSRRSVEYEEYEKDGRVIKILRQKEGGRREKKKEQIQGRWKKMEERDECRNIRRERASHFYK